MKAFRTESYHLSLPPPTSLDIATWHAIGEGCTTQLSHPRSLFSSPSSCLPAAGLASKVGYLHGVFTANLKLPSGFSAGVVTTFYLTSTFGSQSRRQQRHQDELDFEFLGDTTSRKIRLGTNYYAHGVGTNTHEEGVSPAASLFRVRKAGE